MSATHGYTAYTYGCRCDECKDAKRRYVAQRRKLGLEKTREGATPAADRPAWHQQATPSKSRVGVSRFTLDLAEHNSTGYRRGCRCWTCTDDLQARRRAKKQIATRQ